jgi:hypothetical protein
MGSRAKPKQHSDNDQVVVASEAASWCQKSQLEKAGRQREDCEVVVANPFPMKPIPSKVLTEDDYTDAVSHIIERDFFPDLAHLRIRHELLQARESGDWALAQDLQWKLVNLSRPTPLSSVAATPGRMTPGATPLRAAELSGAVTPAGATPRISSWERDDDDVESTVAVPSDMPSNAALQLADGKQVVVDLQKVRLDDFHRVFTSEDNAAFEEILKRDYERKAAKQWWIEHAEKEHNTERKRYKNAIMDGAEVEKTNGALLGTEFQARNTFSFKPPTLPLVEVLEKPKVDFKNTRFTTAQQAELDSMLDVSVASRQAHLQADRDADSGDRMAQSGQFGISAFMGGGTAAMRSLGGRCTTPLLPDREVRGYPLVQTPTLLPGVGGLSPLMTYGKLGSTPRCLEGDGTSFKMNEISERERAAERLQRGATQKLRETKQHTKLERLRALGLTPSGSVTPARTSRSTPGAGSTGRHTPGSMAKVTPLSPIGALIQRAQKMAQQGGRLRIAQSPATPALTPADEAPPRKRRKKTSGDDAERLPSSITDNLL